GTALTLSATADALSRFAGFEGACAGSQCAATLRADLPVVARFEQRRYSLVDLGVPGGANWTAAAGISRQGQMVTGTWGEANGIVDLGSLAKDGCSLAKGVNSKGIIVGSSCTVAAGVRGARFRGPDEIDDLGSLGGTTVATAISDSGIIVGYSYVPSGVYHAFVYADGKMIDAGTLPGTDRSQFSAVNSAGVAVGESSNDGDSTPVIYAAGRLADLAALVDTTAYTLGSASGIDEEGNIVATARLSGWWRAVLLRPK